MYFETVATKTITTATKHKDYTTLNFVKICEDSTNIYQKIVCVK
ncbi:hypothetical protein DOY81_000528 [Sarcophaga bullata]|nr:hypothetical protein DOY81_000528 [Sarcophaga bullata]